MNKPVNQSGWKPGTPLSKDEQGEYPTVTGNKALMLEEPLIFEIADDSTTGVDIATTETDLPSRLGPNARTKGTGLPGLAEPSGGGGGTEHRAAGRWIP